MQLQELPSNPGVYQMLDKDSTIIYIGKARNIKKRVSQYFSKSQKDYKTIILIQHIRHIQPIITSSEHEALILEAQLIKQFSPRFNILLKDDKTYPYIKITINEPFPRIIITRQKLNDKALYFGPYTSYGSSRKLRKLLYDLFPLRDCTQSIDLINTQKKCIKLDIGKCLGPCVKKDIYEQYQETVEYCINYLNGNDDSIIQSLTEKMNHASKHRQYERAATIRDNIQQLQKLSAQRQIELGTGHDYYFISYSSNNDYHYFIAQHYRRKKFISQYGTYFNDHLPLNDFLEQSLIHILSQLPHQTVFIVCSMELADIIEKIKQDLSLPLLKIVVPHHGVKFELLTLVNMNAKKSLLGLSKSLLKRYQPSPLSLLQRDLKLASSPDIIFGCDISHFYGTDVVSSVVVFIDGKPAKQYYRHFNIKTITTGKSDDTKAMKETVISILNHFTFLPNLLLIDGGKGQLNAALKALKSEKEHTIYCISLAKKNEEIYQPGHKEPIQLSHHHSGLSLLRHVRDESHRFALNFQRTKRHLRYNSKLDQIHGLGKKRIKNLYKHFKSFDNIKKASVSELTGVDSIHEELAQKIFQFFNH